VRPWFLAKTDEAPLLHNDRRSSPHVHIEAPEAVVDMTRTDDPNLRAISASQVERLGEVHLELESMGALAAPAAARRLTEILATAVAVLHRDRNWVLDENWPPSAEVFPVRELTPALEQVIGGAPERTLAASSAGNRTWTLLGCPHPTRPHVVALRGDWIAAATVFARVARNLTLAFAASDGWILRQDRVRLFRLARLLSHASGLTAVGHAIVRHMAGAVDARIGAVAVVGADNHLAIVATHGYPLSLVEHLRIESGAGVLGTVLQTGRPFWVTGGSTFPLERPRRPRYHTDSFIAVPLIAARDVLGVAAVTDHAANQPFTRDHLTRLRILAAPAALALQRERALSHAEAYAHAAAVDPVSGAFNRRYFQVRLEEELQRSRRHDMPLALLMIDIDDFKVINDSFGHPVGDAVIRDVAEILRHSVRVFDVCARYGGEEFAIVMPGSDNAEKIAERIRERVEAYRSADRLLADLHITVSVGLAVSSGAMSSRDLIERSDQALYLSKRAGKNRISVLGPEGG
jgi:diguanylate cyclase (GGDEF)-like protein